MSDLGRLQINLKSSQVAHVWLVDDILVARIVGCRFSLEERPYHRVFSLPSAVLLWPACTRLFDNFFSSLLAHGEVISLLQQDIIDNSHFNYYFHLL